jgi:putative DNA primase/helicase
MSDQALGEIAIASIPSFLEVSSISHTVKSGEPEGNSIEHLKKLSGKPEVRNQMFDFKSNINGTWQIIVDGKVTGCWIDSQGYIGSYDKGGPTVVQWLQWYGHTKLNAMVILKKYGIELRKLFGSEQMSDLRSIRPVIAAQKIKEDHQIIYSANRFFQYSNGYYGQCDDEQILRLIIVCLGEEIGKNKLLETFDLLKIYAKCAEQQLNQSSYINFRNGLFNYDTWTISEHSPDLLFTSQLPVNYNPEAICPLWIKTLNEIFEQDQNKINVLQEFIGLCLTKIVKFEKSLILVGEGANGKSVVLSVIEAQMGDENYASVPLEKFDNHFYLAYLFGKTVNISTETNAKAEVYDSTFKSIVSGETLVVDEKHKKPFQYKPFCKLIFAMNNLPRVSDKTDAFFRRILILRLNRVFKKEEQNRNLKDQLAGEREGILSWSLVGLRRLLQRGYFAASAEIEQEVSQYKKENNSVAIFVEEECEVNNSHHVFKDEIYRRYSEFCRLNNYGSFAKNRFGKELIKVIPEIQDGKVTGSRAWYGIK